MLEVGPDRVGEKKSTEREAVCLFGVVQWDHDVWIWPLGLTELPRVVSGTQRIWPSKRRFMPSQLEAKYYPTSSSGNFTCW